MSCAINTTALRDMMNLGAEPAAGWGQVRICREPTEVLAYHPASTAEVAPIISALRIAPWCSPAEDRSMYGYGFEMTAEESGTIRKTSEAGYLG